VLTLSLRSPYTEGKGPDTRSSFSSPVLRLDLALYLPNPPALGPRGDAGGAIQGRDSGTAWASRLCGWSGAVAGAAATDGAAMAAGSMARLAARICRGVEDLVGGGVDGA